ncbi:MAG: hypothetical protein V3W14_06030 [Candidatus Neomarinimicrobiota bacterium]
MNRICSKDHDLEDYQPLSPVAENCRWEYHYVLRVITHQKRCLATQEEQTKQALRKAFRDIIVKRIAIQHHLSDEYKFRSIRPTPGQRLSSATDADLVNQLHVLSLALDLIEHPDKVIGMYDSGFEDHSEDRVSIDFGNLRRGLAGLGIHEQN